MAMALARNTFPSSIDFTFPWNDVFSNFRRREVCSFVFCF